MLFALVNGLLWCEILEILLIDKTYPLSTVLVLPMQLRGFLVFRTGDWGLGAGGDEGVEGAGEAGDEGEWGERFLTHPPTLPTLPMPYALCPMPHALCP